MNFFADEIVVPASHLPITTSDPDLAAAVTEEIERTIYGEPSSPKQSDSD